MNEIEKLYENAKVKPFRYCYNCVDNNGNRIENSANCPSRHNCSNTCDTPEYEFTAEKQLKLIKWLSDTDYYITEFCRLIDTREYYIETDYKHFQSSSFEETLAGLINKLWKDLTEEEKQKVREILE